MGDTRYAWRQSPKSLLTRSFFLDYRMNELKAHSPLYTRSLNGQHLQTHSPVKTRFQSPAVSRPGQSSDVKQLAGLTGTTTPNTDKPAMDSLCSASLPSPLDSSLPKRSHLSSSLFHLPNASKGVSLHSEHSLSPDIYQEKYSSLRSKWMVTQSSLTERLKTLLKETQLAVDNL